MIFASLDFTTSSSASWYMSSMRIPSSSSSCSMGSSPPSTMVRLRLASSRHTHSSTPSRPSSSSAAMPMGILGPSSSASTARPTSRALSSPVTAASRKNSCMTDGHTCSGSSTSHSNRLPTAAAQCEGATTQGWCVHTCTGRSASFSDISRRDAANSGKALAALQAEELCCTMSLWLDSTPPRLHRMNLQRVRSMPCRRNRSDEAREATPTHRTNIFTGCSTSRS
mmetsp:Transcript_25430/g.54986  ORF Transcript_25430/g.54986 Transcript_25430/m.54986 type:complete len:225 (+) Transcript_25430:1936-2610(+)